jgi:TP901 family phage tail tape measure protein
VRVVLDAAVGGFVGGMGAAAQSAVGFARTAGTAIDNNRQAMDTLSSSAFKVGAGLTALAGFAVKAAMDWESAWTGVLKTVEGTPGQLALVEQGLRDLATSMPESHQNIAAVAEAAGQLGIARENVVGFTKTMVMLGDTTNLTAEEAATSMAQFMNIMGTAPADVGRLGAALVELGNNGASTERQIIEMAQRIAGAGRIVGLTEQDVLGLSSAVASTGIEVEAGGTAISTALIAASKAVATGSAELNIWNEVARKGGLQAKDFATAWREDPAAAFLAFERGLNTMGQDAFKVLGQIGLDGARVGRALLNLAGANELLAQSFSDSDRAFRQNRALLIEAEKRYDTTAAKAEIAWNKIKDAAIGAGQGLLPVVAGIAEAVGGAADAFGQLPGPVKGFLTGITGIAGVALLATAGIMKLATAVRSVGVAMGVMGAGGTAGGAGGGAVLGGFARGATIAAVGITALSVAVNKFSKTAPAEVKQFAAAFNQLSNDGTIDQVRKDLEGLVNVRFEKDTFKNLFQDMDEPEWVKAGGDLLGLVGLDPFKSSRESVEAMDNALTQMVESGSIDEAQMGFRLMADEAAKQGVSMAEFTAQMPNYQAALKNIGTEADNDAAAFRQAAGGAEYLAMRLQSLDSDPAKAEEALAKLREESSKTARSFMGFTEDLKESGKSFDQWAKGVMDSAKAAADFQENLVRLAIQGVPRDWLAELEGMGPEAGGKLVEGLADATDAERAKLIDAWLEAASTVNQAVNDIDPHIITQFDVKGDKDAVEKAAAVALQYGITPEVVETILKADNWAKDDIEAVLALMEEYEQANPTTTVDADTNPAVAQMETLLGWIDSTTGTVPIDGDPKPGEGAAKSFQEYVDSLTGTETIDGNNKPAKKDADAAKKYADSKKGTIRIDGMDASARDKVNAFLRWARGFTVKIPIIGSFKLLGAMGMRVPPGYAAGGIMGYANGRVPGQPPSDPTADNVHARTPRGGALMVRSGEWIVNEPQSAKNDNWLRAINSGLDLNKVFGPPEEVLRARGFADGGAWQAAWNSAAPSMQASGTPAGRGGREVVSLDLAGLEIGFDPSGLAYIARGEARAVVAEERRTRQQNLTRKIVRS